MISHPVYKHFRYIVSKLRGKGPSFLFYYLTLRCNSQCRYCHVPKIPKPFDADSMEVIQNLRSAEKMGITHLILTGGEPLLYRDLKPVLDAARRLGFHVTLTTNALTYPELARDLVGLIDNLEFSLPAADPKTYAFDRGVNGNERVIDALKLAIALGEKPVVSATVTDENLPQIPSLVSFTKRVGVMLLLKPACRYFGNMPLRNEGARHFSCFKRKRNVWYNQAFIEFFASGGNRVTSPKCQAGASTIAISPSNGLYLPCFHHIQEELPIDGDLEATMRTPKVQTYKENRGRWRFCDGCKVICYFEDAFLWPPGSLFIKDIVSRIRWLDRWWRYH